MKWARSHNWHSVSEVRQLWQPPYLSVSTPYLSLAHIHTFSLSPSLSDCLGLSILLCFGGRGDFSGSTSSSGVDRGACPGRARSLFFRDRPQCQPGGNFHDSVIKRCRRVMQSGQPVVPRWQPANKVQTAAVRSVGYFLRRSQSDLAVRKPPK